MEEIAGLIVIGILWGVFAIIQAIAESIADGKRKRANELKRSAKEAWTQRRNHVKLLNEGNKKQWAEDHKAWGKKVIEEQLELSAPIRSAYLEEEKKWKEKIKEEQSILNAERHKQWQERQNIAQSAYDEKLSIHEEMLAAYYKIEQKGVLYYNDAILTLQNIPDGFPTDHQLQYSADSKTLIVNYSLPNPKDIKTLKEVKYIKSRNELKETHLSPTALNKLYDEVIYQLTLATLKLICTADDAKAIEHVAFNGWVRAINGATGKETNSIILSMYVTKDEILEIDFSNVAPKECFKALKGVGSSQLHSITPVPPILNQNTGDKRFIESYQVADQLESTVNLASMDWEDFEHLVREIFEKEFAINGGEVKVTQSSADGGVDAIAFDPDPIKGGKIIIQAKRYTNTVGVSAVRDLHGTIQHEGAMKGILVTTSNFGPDSIKWAMGKPITLLNGANLLHLLQKHGYQAQINIAEAKKTYEESK